MSRRPRPAWPWRLLAWVLLFAGAAISLPALLLTPVSKLYYIPIVWVAIGGAVAYAYGRAARPLWFWRLFSCLISLYTMWDVGRYLGRFATTLRDGSEMSGSAMATVFIGVPLIILLCIALLRHAQLLRGEQRSAMRDLEGVFA